MTNREFLLAVASANELAENVREYATNAIAKIDKANAVRAAKPSKAHEENAAMIPTVSAYLATCTVPVPASLVAQNVGTLSPSKAQAVLTLMVQEGAVGIEKIKSTAKSGGKVNGYYLIEK